MNVNMITSKYDHLYAFIAIVVIAILLVLFFPELWDGNTTRFATIGFFVTLYGVIFTILEVVRTKSAANLVKSEIQKIIVKIENLSGLRLLSECQAAIDIAIKVIDDHGEIPLAMLTAILKIYTEHFHEEMENPKSTYRHNSAMLQSFAEVSSRKKSLNNMSKIRRTFVAMTIEISTAIAHKTKNGMKQ